LKICISRGSVATRLRCAGRFNNHGINNFHSVWRWKNF